MVKAKMASAIEAGLPGSFGIERLAIPVACSHVLMAGLGQIKTLPPNERLRLYGLLTCRGTRSLWHAATQFFKPALHQNHLWLASALATES